MLYDNKKVEVLSMDGATALIKSEGVLLCVTRGDLIEEKKEESNSGVVKIPPKKAKK